MQQRNCAFFSMQNNTGLAAWKNKKRKNIKDALWDFSKQLGKMGLPVRISQL